MENQNRCVFALSGVSGMLIATVLLISILVALTYLGITSQQNVMQKPYVLENPQAIVKFSKDNQKHMSVK